MNNISTPDNGYFDEELLDRSERMAATGPLAVLFISVFTIPAMIVSTYGLLTNIGPYTDTLFVILITVYEAFIIVGLIMLFKARLEDIKYFKRVKVYRQFMDGSSQPAIPLSILADAAGVSNEKALKDFRRLFNSQLVHGFSLTMNAGQGMDNDPEIVLTDWLVGAGNPGETYWESANYPYAFGKGFTEGRQFYDRRRRHSYGRPDKTMFDDKYVLIIIPAMLIQALVFSRLPQPVPLISMAVIIIVLVLFFRWLRQVKELAIRCNAYFRQSQSSRVSVDSIASMMGWSREKTRRALVFLFWDKALVNCSFEGDAVTLLH